MEEKEKRVGKKNKQREVVWKGCFVALKRESK